MGLTTYALFYVLYTLYDLMMANWPKYVVQVNKNKDMYCVLLKPESICFLSIIIVVIINRPLRVRPTSGSIANFHTYSQL